jgi:hypothetical protein
MPGAVGDVFLDQDPEAWRDAVETSAYVADIPRFASAGAGGEFMPLSPPSWKDFAHFETGSSTVSSSHSSRTIDLQRLLSRRPTLKAYVKPYKPR